VPGEFDFIQWIRTQQKPSELAPLPAGDDLAMLKWPEKDLLLVGVDQVLDGVHFDSTVHSPRQIGRKAMNRNLSDCAAMGCLPAAAVVTIASPAGTGIDYLKELYLGIKEAGDKFNCEIVGGDTASWPGKLAVTVSILGRTGGVKPVTRSGAKPGDQIYVTGPLGGSILGRHMTFEPRVILGRQLAEAGVTSMIDLSDGLSRDIRHICEQSGVGAVIDEAAIPIHDDAIDLAIEEGLEPLQQWRISVQHALHDGEDYELLFTGPRDFGAQMIRIGTFEQEPGIWLRQTDHARRPLDPRGWEHTL
jgi:thiamine-monophosphate kinase